MKHNLFLIFVFAEVCVEPVVWWLNKKNSGFKICKELYYQEGKYNYASQLWGGTVVMCSPQGDFITPRICIECLFNKRKSIPVSGRDTSLKEKIGRCFRAPWLQ